MIDSEKDSKLIERFLDLDLSNDELIVFEEKLAENVEFERKLQTYLIAHKIVNDSFSSSKDKLREQQWKAILNKRDKKKKTPQIKKVKTPWKWVGSIAMGFILVLSIWQLNTTFQKPNMNQLITDSWNKKIGLELSFKIKPGV